MKIKTAIVVFLLTVCPIGGKADNKSPLYTAEINKEQERLIDAIAYVESKGKADAVGDNGAAVGILQIHKVLVDDVNRILGEAKYSYEDRYDADKSRQMFVVYIGHYCPSWNPERAARMWNGGPKGHLKRSTLPYWQKVRRILHDKNK